MANNDLLMKKHIYRVGTQNGAIDAPPEKAEQLRKIIEPWLSAVFQSEHLSLLLGNGFSIGILSAAGGQPGSMNKCIWQSDLIGKDKVDEFATDSAKKSERGTANIEDQLRSAMCLYSGLQIWNLQEAKKWKNAIDEQLKNFMVSLFESECSILKDENIKREEGENLLVSFLLSFACRAASRERLNLFTTNYDRLIEYGCDLAGLRVIDRFVGALSPVFRTTRLNIDMHYNPPGIRGEPRYLEGVIRLTKLHGSLDWKWEKKNRELRRQAIPFGAQKDHPSIPQEPSETVMIYPNPAKDVETLDYPYAELFRDFAASVCRPNSSLVTYGYGFGDDHINRVIKDMLTIPSTHLVIIAWDQTKPEKTDDESNGIRKRIINFCSSVGRDAQISLLLGDHFADMGALVNNYLPKPSIDTITIRKANLEKNRNEGVTEQEQMKSGNTTTGDTNESTH